MGIIPNETPEQKFWSWFQKNESEIYASGSEPTSTINELADQLSEYKSGVTYEISVEEDGKKGFIISADGIRDLFQDVVSLYKAAPALEKWEVIAFRPPMQNFSSIKLRYAGEEFDPNKLWIHPIIDEDFFDLIVFYPGLTDENKNIVISGVYILLDTVLGEYDVVTGIRYLDHHNLPDDPEGEGLIPFVKLRDIYDEFRGMNG